MRRRLRYILPLHKADRQIILIKVIHQFFRKEISVAISTIEYRLANYILCHYGHTLLLKSLLLLMFPFSYCSTCHTTNITKVYTVSFFLAFILPSKSSKIKYTVESTPYIGIVLLGNFPEMLVLIYDSHNSWPFSKSVFIWPVSLSHAR